MDGQASPATLAANLERVRRRIAEACRLARRDPAEVNLLVVTKNEPAGTVGLLADLGVREVGESRVQEARPKAAALAGRGLTWHLVGHLQANKARQALGFCDWVHSVDRPELLARLERLAGERGRPVNVFLEVNTSGEPAKQGAPPAALGELVEALAGLQQVRPAGLMTMGPAAGGPAAARECFRRLRELRDRFAGRHGLQGGLSMGMSADFPAAIAEGATWLRLGTIVCRGEADAA